MDQATRHLIQTIHDAPGRVMIVTAGAGTMALAWLLGVAGASRTLLEAVIPYDEASFDDFLGRKPQQYVAATTAGFLAGRAVNRARKLCPDKKHVIGLACTATLITDRPKLGEHRAHISTWAAGKINHYGVVLSKGARDRAGEEEVVSRLILIALAQAYGLELRLPLPLVDGDEVKSEEIDLADAVGQLTRGELDYFTVLPEGRLVTGSGGAKAILAGAFNPLHQGHLALSEAVADILDEQITFELTAVNADKPALNQDEALARLLQFSGSYPVLVSNAPTFVAKSRLLPGATFIVGFDTARRILQLRFYDGSEDRMLAGLAEIRQRQGRFLVAGRADSSGVFHEPSELSIPCGFEDLFQSIPAGHFRQDISSTELRAGNRTGQIDR